MKNISKTVFQAAAAFAFAIVSANAAQSLTGRTDKDSYRIGEEIVFTFSVPGDDSQASRKINWERNGDDGVREKGTAEIAPGGKAEVKTTAMRPGFAQVKAYLLDDGGKQSDNRDSRWIASAAIEPGALQGVDEPQDFDEFWEKQKARLAASPWKNGVKRERVEDWENAKCDLFRISIPAPGSQPATAHMIMPKNAGADSKRPLKIQFHGYGWGGYGKPNPEWYGDGEIILDVNAHGFELGRDADYYKAFEKNATKNGMYGFVASENDNPETVYFNAMILRGLRVLQFAKSLPEWDGKNLTVSGGSQGGFQALLMAGLDGDATFADANVPWLCDMGGKARLGRIDGWQPAFTDALNYYDPIHHARRIPNTCKVQISRNGLGDTVCPPSGISVVYNNITAPKKMVFVQGSEHGDWGGMPAGTQTFTMSEAW